MISSLPWYAIRVRPRYERQVAQSIASKGINTFLPLYAERRQWSDRTKELEKPLFDGYVFCQVDLGKRYPVLVTPGVIHFVGVGRTPVAVDDAEIDAVKAVVDSGAVVRPWAFLKEGDRVRIDAGPLRNVEGILVRQKDHDQVVVSITLLQRAMAVNVDRDWLAPVRPWMPSPEVALAARNVSSRN